MSELGRRTLLKTASVAAGGLMLTGNVALAAPAAASSARRGSGTLSVRWIGGGVVEVATPDNKQVAFIDAWVWNNAAYTVQKVERPVEFSSADAFADYVRGKSPDAVLVLLTHDHGDHMGDYFDVLKALAGAGLNVKTTGQSDLMRGGLAQKFRDAGLDPTQIVANGGAGQNFGGYAQHGAMQAWLVPAVHSNLLGFPAAGYVLEIGGVRIYASGDTDLYGDMRLLADRYHPDVAMVCVGGGPYTMGPHDAAVACQLAGVSQAMPIHYAHNAAVLGVEAGAQFQQAVAAVAPAVGVQVFQLGEARSLTV
ncbi:MAG TPA: MBL fold metallo-hydrolase [Chloroflexota bacterium]|nr:MBL fold metallo-hydrolase [Chloroflexota bacterium]